MLRFKPCRFELLPNGEQERKLRQFAGGVRYVWKRALAIENEQRGKTGRNESGYAASCRELTRWRNDPDTAWLSESPVHTTQQALGDIEAAWSRHFESLKKRKRGEIRPDEVIGPPQFKTKPKSRDSFRYPDPGQFQIEQGNNRVFLPKRGWTRFGFVGNHSKRYGNAASSRNPPRGGTRVCLPVGTAFRPGRMSKVGFCC